VGRFSAKRGKIFGEAWKNFQRSTGKYSEKTLKLRGNKKKMMYLCNLKDRWNVFES
jgi:hypothetical protein